MLQVNQELSTRIDGIVTNVAEQAKTSISVVSEELIRALDALIERAVEAKKMIEQKRDAHHDTINDFVLLSQNVMHFVGDSAKHVSDIERACDENLDDRGDRFDDVLTTGSS